ncbi:MAG TPA: carboxypeptidase-like regulatory domain-containing protein, partial [Patescibacteria group bacterium]|nr:carboxypeptidase-like regulatory domain-containing protein [Patescibacteria group bacterium]
MVTVAVFAILLSGVLGCFAAVSTAAKAGREKTILASLSASYMETVRNMPYSQVGTVNGNPNGPLPDQPNAYTQVIGATAYKIYYEVTYIDDSADGTISAGTDPYPADYKQVKMSIQNTATSQVTDFVTNVVPQGLEGTTNAGALQVKVINAQGNPVPGASVNITYPASGSPTINLTRTADASGQWTEVGLPPGVNAYHVAVTAGGYTSDQTYPITAQNPNPIHPNPTVANGQVTSLTLSIDLAASLNIKTLDDLCQPLSGVGVNVAGTRLIGSSPDVQAFNNSYASVSGLIDLSGLVWDTYTPTLLTGQSWVARGTSPIQQISVLPGTSQTYTIILSSNTTSASLLVIVKDASSGSALEGAAVQLHEGGGTPQDYAGITGGSVWLQDDWSGGAGQNDWSTTSPTRYYQDDGNVAAGEADVELKKTGGTYAASGWLESGSFDTGTSSTNYTILTWQPPSQSASTSLAFQVAANNDDATWNYVGPDGTAGTFFTTPGQDMGNSLDNNRYVRYKAYLSTADGSMTPVLSSLAVNFVTGCFTPGQVSFPNLDGGNNYSLTVSMPGYTTQTINNLNITGNQSLEVLMSP